MQAIVLFRVVLVYFVRAGVWDFLAQVAPSLELNPCHC
jgi:hypothetical protein